MKLLLGYDGKNPISRDIHDLKRAGLPKKLTALVITAVDSFVPPPVHYSEIGMPDSTMAYIEATREDSRKKLKKECEKAKKTVRKAAALLKKAFPGWSVKSEVVVDSPQWGLLKKAESFKADLIVVGSHKASPAAKFFLGSVSRSLLIHAKKAIRIVRRHQKGLMGPVKIVVGMDGSRYAQKVVREICARNWPLKTEVRLVTAFDQNMASAIAFQRLPLVLSASAIKRLRFPNEQSRILALFKPYCEKLQAKRLRVKHVVKAGTPWKILTKEAEAWKADCIFLGARGLGMVDRILLGSVSNAVASRAHCSVEVIRD